MFLLFLALPFASRSAAATVDSCPGDCNSDGNVSVDEVLRLLNVALGIAELGDCVEGDLNADTRIEVDELVKAVEALLARCDGFDVTGRWAGTVTIAGFDTSIRLELSQSGPDVTGFYEAPYDFEQGTVTGVVVGRTITQFQILETTPDCPGKFDGTATVVGNEMSFELSGENCDGRATGQGTASRVDLCNGSNSPCCGNDVQERDEECDRFDAATCQELGFDGGQTDCLDCRLNTRNCFAGGQCVVAGECGDPECIVLCPGEGFVVACLSDVCIVGSCACTENFDQCCALAGGP